MKPVRRIFLIAAILIVIVLGVLTYIHFDALTWRVIAWRLGIPQPKYEVAVDEDVMTPMRDGMLLAADVYRPDAPGKFPVVVTRTPYSKRNVEHKYKFASKLFASQGFVSVVQDVRGKFASGGYYYPYMTEAEDGHDTLEWAGEQEWSSGAVGMYGFSYWGSTQWLSAPYRSERLKAMVPIVTSQNVYESWIYNGVFRWNDLLFWHYGTTCPTRRDLDGIDLDEAVRRLPLIEADDALGVDIAAFNHWISNPTPGRYWDQIRVDDKVGQIKAPALLISGWYDYYLELTLADFNRMISEGGSEEARMSRIIIGPWTHKADSEFDDVDFGPEADFMLQVKTLLNWYDYWLRGGDSGTDEPGARDEGPVRIFVMGANEWRAESEWPLARTRYEKYYLHSSGRANTASGDGELSDEAPGGEPPDHFVYDPANPAPSVGGTSVYGAATPGPRDQREVEKRGDALVYTTGELDEDVEVTGPVRLTLYAASSARDTDFSAKLVDVYPDGRAINIRVGMLRARYRDSLTEPSFLERGVVYEFDIEVGSTSNVFRKGHRIRLEVSSSYFPEFSRNLNTGAEIGMTSEMVTADQTVYHDAERPSHLTLPIIPGDG
jgi:putative CocE/NonD family hydrolase